jgi:ABC-type transport system substrate-binding protein
MKPRNVRSPFAVCLLLALILPVLAACGGPATPAAEPSPQIIRETVIVEGPTPEPQVIRETVVVRETVEAPTPEATETEEAAGGTEGTEGATGAFTTPHPILGDVRVRQALAYCTNRPELIESVYPYLNDEQKEELLMDTFLPRGHWAAATDNITTYEFDAEQGSQLLEDAGWTLAEGASVRTNANGDSLNLRFTTTNAQFRQTWATVLESQLLQNCGIQIIRTHAPASFWFGARSGLAVRDFELGAYAWVGEADPGGLTLYACNQIPLPDNNWEGQNYMGWCNERASRAIIAANNTLDREERIRQYAIVQEEFTKDMVSLPLFNRSEAAAASNDLVNFRPNPTEYFTANAGEWELQDGGDTLVIGFSQEPASLFTLVENAAVAVMAADLLGARLATTYDYDYQAGSLVELPTIENGRATNEDVEISEGDIVWGPEGEPITVTDGVELTNAEGEAVTFDGSPITMKQLSVTFEHVEGLTWEDGEPVKQADFELFARISCDPESGAVSFTICNSREGIEYTDDRTYTITYLPGVQWPEYSIQGLGAYPSHQVLADGRNLADVPASEWATLPEIAEDPLSNGPYKLVEWVKGERIVYEANENYYGGQPAIQNVIIQFFADTNQAVAQLLTGDVDVLEPATLGGGAEVETVLQAAAEGRIQAETIASPTWEHIDMNIFVR